MRVLAYIAAFVVILGVGYWLLAHGYPHYMRHFHSHFMAKTAMFGTMIFTIMGTLWAVKRLP